MEQSFVTQREFTLRPRARGFHLITDEIIRNLPRLPQAGLLHLFIKHTSAGLSMLIRMSRRTWKPSSTTW